MSNHPISGHCPIPGDPKSLNELVSSFDEHLNAKRMQACAENAEPLAEMMLNLRDRFRLIRIELEKELKKVPRPKSASKA